MGISATELVIIMNSLTSESRYWCKKSNIDWTVDMDMYAKEGSDGVQDIINRNKNVHDGIEF